MLMRCDEPSTVMSLVALENDTLYRLSAVCACSAREQDERIGVVVVAKECQSSA